MENGEAGSDMVEKPTLGGRKHSLPQQLDTAGVRQVSRSKGTGAEFRGRKVNFWWKVLFMQVAIYNVHG